MTVVLKTEETRPFASGTRPVSFPLYFRLSQSAIILLSNHLRSPTETGPQEQAPTSVTESDPPKRCYRTSSCGMDFCFWPIVRSLSMLDQVFGFGLRLIR